MQEKLREYFLSLGIEYFSVISYADCKINRERIILREGFTPRSVIIYLLPYYSEPTGNLSAYAAPRDYHVFINEVNSGIKELIAAEYPLARMKGYGDHSPINERHAALISGLGILGDNGLLINKEYGSYVFIGELITDVSPEDIGASAPIDIERCISCGACRQACPTAILSGGAEECLSHITQKKGTLTNDEARLMVSYNTVWGCDICQRVCPYNTSVKTTPIAFFREGVLTTLTRELLDNMSEEELSSRAFSWKGREVLERNLRICSPNGNKCLQK